MRHRHRVDANSAVIRQCAEACGWYWGDLSQSSAGFDAFLAKGGRIVFVEIKDGSKSLSRQHLTPHELEVHQRLRAHGVHVHLVTCVDDLDQLERPQFARMDG